MDSKILYVFEFLLKNKIADYNLFLNKFYGFFLSEAENDTEYKRYIINICNELNILEDIYSSCLEKKVNFKKYSNKIENCLETIKINLTKYLLKCIEYNCTGQIIYGKYLNNCIYIDREQDNNIYNITMWNKDNNQDQQQFTFKTKKEVEKFFRENDMIVKWENNS